jgi:four helix bundle protein
MKDSKAFKEWQRDLLFLAASYDIPPGYDIKAPVDIFAQLLQAAAFVPDEVERKLNGNDGSSLSSFLKTSAGSLIELHNLLKISLNLDMISISEYHALTKSLYEIGELIKNIILEYNSKHRIPAKK